MSYKNIMSHRDATGEARTIRPDKTSITLRDRGQKS